VQFLPFTRLKHFDCLLVPGPLLPPLKMGYLFIPFIAHIKYYCTGKTLIKEGGNKGEIILDFRPA